MDDEQNVATIAQYVVNHHNKPLDKRTDADRAALAADMVTLHTNVNRWLRLHGEPHAIGWLGRLVGIHTVIEQLTSIEGTLAGMAPSQEALEAALVALKQADTVIDSIEPTPTQKRKTK